MTKLIALAKKAQYFTTGIIPMLSAWLQAKSEMSLASPLLLEIASVESSQLEMLIETTAEAHVLNWGSLCAGDPGLEECPQTIAYLHTFDVSLLLSCFIFVSHVKARIKALHLLANRSINLAATRSF